MKTRMTLAAAIVAFGCAAAAPAVAVAGVNAEEIAMAERAAAAAARWLGRGEGAAAEAAPLAERLPLIQRINPTPFSNGPLHSFGSEGPVLAVCGSGGAVMGLRTNPETGVVSFGACAGAWELRAR